MLSIQTQSLVWGGWHASNWGEWWRAWGATTPFFGPVLAASYCLDDWRCQVGTWALALGQLSSSLMLVQGYMGPLKGWDQSLESRAPRLRLAVVPGQVSIHLTW